MIKLFNFLFLIFLSSCIGTSPDKLIFEGATEGNLEKVKKAVEEGVVIDVEDVKVFGVDDSDIKGPPTMRLDNSGNPKFKSKSYEMNKTLAGLGKTPLMIAARDGHLEIVKFLISKGANLYKTDSMGRSSLAFALLQKKSNVADFLISKMDDFSTPVMGLPLTNIALKNELEDLLFKMLDRGADINQTTTGNSTAIRLKGKCTLLYYSVKWNKFSVFKELIKRGADVNYACGGETLLISSIRDDVDIKYIDLLVKAKAEINAVDSFAPGYKPTMTSNKFEKNYALSVAKRFSKSKVIEYFGEKKYSYSCKPSDIFTEIQKFENKYGTKRSFHTVKALSKELGCSEKEVCLGYDKKDLRTSDLVWQYCAKVKNKKHKKVTSSRKVNKCDPTMIGQYVVEYAYQRHSIPKMAQDLGCKTSDVCKAFIHMYPRQKDKWTLNCKNKGFM